jgi:hypothetical protein
MICSSRWLGVSFTCISIVPGALHSPVFVGFVLHTCAWVGYECVAVQRPWLLLALMPVYVGLCFRCGTLACACIHILPQLHQPGSYCCLAFPSLSFGSFYCAGGRQFVIL